MKTLRLWWKWRKAKRREYPLRYVGPTIIARGVKLEHGTPLQMEVGRRGAPGGRRFLAPDGIIRVLARDEVEWR